MDAKLIPSNVVEALGRSGAHEFDDLKHVQKYLINPKSAKNNRSR